jgi:8-oxo-dGTP pyrophosphatase MutT (NUDIX family)
MAQKYRIYINEKVILITDSQPKRVESYEKIDADVFDLKIIYTWILAHHSRFFYVPCHNAKALFKNITNSITVIEAAGGLVKNERNEYLFIYRNDKWDIPKGKIEKDERIKVAAVREVEEECGITVNKLGEKICKTYHVYLSRGEVVLKKTHWFEMSCKGQDKLKPQKEEGITDARWFKKGQIDTILANTFPSIVDVLVKEDLIDDLDTIIESGAKSQEPGKKRKVS